MTPSGPTAPGVPDERSAAVEAVPYVYGPTVMFYGKPYTQAQLMAEKARAVRHWPVRRYHHRPGTMQVICNVPEQKCGARSVIDFETEDTPGTGHHAGEQHAVAVSG